MGALWLVETFYSHVKKPFRFSDWLNKGANHVFSQVDSNRITQYVWNKNIYTTVSDWIYVNMASVSVFRSSAIRMCLVSRLSPSPPRTMGNCLHLPLSSAISTIIIIVRRSLIQLARAQYQQVKPLVNTAPYWRSCVKIASPYPTSFAP